MSSTIPKKRCFVRARKRAFHAFRRLGLGALAGIYFIAAASECFNATLASGCEDLTYLLFGRREPPAESARPKKSTPNHHVYVSAMRK